MNFGLCSLKKKKNIVLVKIRIYSACIIFPKVLISKEFFIYIYKILKKNEIYYACIVFFLLLLKSI